LVDLNDFISEVASKVNSAVSKITGNPEELYEATFHILKAGGKRLRPALLFASGLAFGAKEEDLLPFAVGVELFHNFTLVHDDIMDNDDFRRGVPTVHRVYGIPMAILSGDLLFSLSMLIPLSHCAEKMQSNRCIEASRKLAWASVTVAEGQALDMMFEKMAEVTEEQYFDMIYKKTAALIEASVYMGGILGKAGEEELKLLSRYGRDIGLAFQIVDDILGIYGNEEETGKPLYSDLREGKKTLMVIKAIQLSGPSERKLIDEVLGKRNLEREKYARVAELMERLGVLEYARSKAEGLVSDALQSIRELEKKADQAYLSVLKDMALLVIKRRK